MTDLPVLMERRLSSCGDYYGGILGKWRPSRIPLVTKMRIARVNIPWTAKGQWGTSAPVYINPSAVRVNVEEQTQP